MFASLPESSTLTGNMQAEETLHRKMGSRTFFDRLKKQDVFTRVHKFFLKNAHAHTPTHTGAQS